jgi:transposase
MQRRKFSREFKVEAVRLVRERGVSAAQAACDLDVHENVSAQMGEGIRL